MLMKMMRAKAGEEGKGGGEPLAFSASAVVVEKEGGEGDAAAAAGSRSGALLRRPHLRSTNKFENRAFQAWEQVLLEVGW